ncbi:MAG: DUF3990 domain-containing protein [Agathobacter sp.]
MNMTCNKILFHGATVEVSEPLVTVGRKDLDFGQGFYLTNDQQQAIDWSITKALRKKNAKPIVNVYEFDVDRFVAADNYRMLIFSGYTTEWLDFISQSRKGLRPWESLDWIEGGIANDHVISTVDAYIDGFITPGMAMDRLINEKLHHQICILNQEIIDRYLIFVESFEAKVK